MRKIGFVIDSTFGYQGKDDVSIVPLKVIINDKEYVDGQIEPKIVVESTNSESFC